MHVRKGPLLWDIVLWGGAQGGLGGGRESAASQGCSVLPPCLGMLSRRASLGLEAPVPHALSSWDQPLLGTPTPYLGCSLNSPQAPPAQAGTKAPYVILSVLGSCLLSFLCSIGRGSRDTHSLPTGLTAYPVGNATRSPGPQGFHARYAVCWGTAEHDGLPFAAKSPVATLGGPVVAFPWPHPPLLAICGWNSISVSWNTWVRGCFLTSVHAAGSHPRQETWARAGQAGLDGARDRAHGDVSLTLALCLLKAEWQVAEAEALVHTLDGWSVVERMVVPTKTPDGKLIFGKGTLEHLTGGSLLPSLPERNRATQGLSPGPYRGVLMATWIRHRGAHRASLTVCSVPSGATGAIQSRGTPAPRPPAYLPLHTACWV